MRSLVNRIRAQYSQVPLLGWLVGALVAVILEQLIGTPLARALGMSKMPVLFGFVIMFSQPILIPSALVPEEVDIPCDLVVGQAGIDVVPGGHRGTVLPVVGKKFLAQRVKMLHPDPVEATGKAGVPKC